MRYVSIKVCIQDTESSPIFNEISMLRHLRRCGDKRPDSPGLLFTRLADDIFELDSPSGGRHYCIVSKPHASNVRSLQEHFPDAIVPKLLVRSLIHRVLFSVAFLHATCNVAHTGRLLARYSSESH